MVAHKPLPKALDDRDVERLSALLQALPAALEPLDVSALDGYLVGVLLQPAPVPASRWLARVHDAEGRPAPPGLSLAPLQALAQRRHAELERAIDARRWFDPWVFEPEPGPGADAPAPSAWVLPWVAGFALALEAFPALLQSLAGADAVEPLAVLYSHFDADDLEDMDGALLEAMAALEPPPTPEDAVEDLVRCTLLLADVTRPQRRTAKR